MLYLLKSWLPTSSLQNMMRDLTLNPKNTGLGFSDQSLQCNTPLFCSTQLYLKGIIYNVMFFGV